MIANSKMIITYVRVFYNNNAIINTLEKENEILKSFI
jgi:hypothetical protein